MFIKSLGIGFSGLIVLVASAWAAPSTLEGTVKDANGQALKSADVRIEARQGTNFSKTVKTDAKGHYVSEPLSAGNYRVTLLVNGTTEASINNTTIKIGESTQLNFNLKKETGSQAKKKATHMVYVPSETGSHIGGRWVEVDDNGNANTAGADNVSRGGASMLKGLQGNGATQNSNAGSH